MTGSGSVRTLPGTRHRVASLSTFRENKDACDRQSYAELGQFGLRVGCIQPYWRQKQYTQIPGNEQRAGIYLTSSTATRSCSGTVEITDPRRTDGDPGVVITAP